ncbi:MAG: hypothetical protein HY207_00820 [Nitrospirae bacterium]|nr:hypothetical protein [Nitrospirota bacterium]
MSDLLTRLCPMFKEEVYLRTARIGNITMLGAAGLVGGMLWFATRADEFDDVERLLCAAGVAILVGTLLYQISREAARHAGAKLALIRVERALGVFEAGRYLPGEPLYPEEWKIAPPVRRATTVPSLVLILIAVLFVVEILIAG